MLITQHTAACGELLPQADGTWSFAFAKGKKAVARLRSLEIDLPLSEVYAKVELPAAVEEEG